MNEKIVTKVYLHSDKDSMFDKGIQLELSQDALAEFKYALYEVEFEIEVNKDTGKYEILKVDGKNLAKE